MKNCVVCGNEFVFDWTIFHGRGEYIYCGMTYMIAGFNDRTETTYCVTYEFLEVFKEHWKQTKEYACITFVETERHQEGKAAFIEWLTEHHPKYIVTGEQKQ